ncbi:ankyrin repeat domain-containing protein [Archangium lansingense]|uniref:Ankyrin repeat domain-containing protein n=1 Tax=Archangium lansingense TaxID=2995310 RepID=A0ABT4ANQ3_9BACT|nr:ankyrin repeat domain-containing protein [Archangium lansinium]MCY1083216.1 ankyrin repeat domain-containing protein [Archangium lansinium]
MTNLIDAVRRGDTAAVEALLDTEPRALARGDEQGMTPLMWAAWHGHAPLVQRMLELGADAAARDSRGTTALMLAAERGHLEASRLLVGRAGPDERGEALRHAVGAGRLELVVWLLDEAGAALEYGGTDGKTPLTCAALGGHAALAEELLRRGADVEARSSTFLPFENRDDFGWHPLHYAADRRYALLVQLLLDAGAKADAETSEGTTPLMMAARRGDEDCIRLLLLAGAEPLRENARRQSALSLSRSYARPHITRLLERRAEDQPLAKVLQLSWHHPGNKRN